jgi:hypothetical protein
MGGWPLSALATEWLHFVRSKADNPASPRSFPQVRSCGDERNRTANPRLAKAVLCQLSYVPEGAQGSRAARVERPADALVTDRRRHWNRRPAPDR